MNFMTWTESCQNCLTVYFRKGKQSVVFSTTLFR